MNLGSLGHGLPECSNARREVRAAHVLVLKK